MVFSTWKGLFRHPKHFVRSAKVKLFDGAQRALRVFGLEMTTLSEIENLRSSKRAAFDLQFLMRLAEYLPLTELKFLLTGSRSQLRQDLFVLAMLRFPKNGYFVEVGATDGISLSNSYFLERAFEWSGILAEPARVWHESLFKNRSCKVDSRAVWSISGDTLAFREPRTATLATLDLFSSVDLHAREREDGKLYPVSTVSLLELLETHGAPKVIDYLSIDTEGSELEILRVFDFSQYTFKVITVEHNFTIARESINGILNENGFFRVLEDLSSFDDWYLNGDYFQKSSLSLRAESP